MDIVSHSKFGVKWDTYILNCIKIAHSKMWILKRLAEIGASIDDLRIAYLSRVRVHLELNVPLWKFAISKTMSKKIERVQKACLFIILGRHATSDYMCNLAMLNLEPLANRREVLCNKFARKHSNTQYTPKCSSPLVEKMQDLAEKLSSPIQKLQDIGKVPFQV